jgi:hypothetical protein
MSQVLGLGISPYPPLSGLDRDMANILRGRLADPDIPAAAKDPANWPAAMRAEWADPVAAAARHREAMLVGLRRVRRSLVDFDPDVVLIFGDDQDENGAAPNTRDQGNPRNRKGTIAPPRRLSDQ